MTETESEVSRRLVKAIASGDRSAEAEMYGRYHSGVLAMLRIRSKDPELAKGLCNDAFVIVLPKLREGNACAPDKLAPYIHGVAKNVLRNHYRKVEAQNTYCDSEIADRTACVAAGPARQLAQEELARAVLLLLAELRQRRDRQLLRRFYLDEQDKERICYELELSAQQFNNVLCRAKKRCRELIKNSVTPGIFDPSDDDDLPRDNK